LPFAHRFLNFGRLLEFVFFFKAAQACIGGSLILLKTTASIGATSSTTTLTPKQLVSLLIDWFILLLCASASDCCWMECRNDGSHHGWKKWKRRTAAALNYRYRRASSDHLDIDTTHL
jgi:hypothetical protein